MHPAALIAFAFAVLYGASWWLYGHHEAAMKKALFAYPRSVRPGQVLSALAVAWGVYHVHQIPFEKWTWVPDVCLYGSPVAWILIVRFMPELLSVRALGALMMLAGVPLLDLIRWHESPARLVLVVVIYLMAVKGMFFTASPYWFRYGVEWMWANPKRLPRIRWGALGMAILMLALVPVLWQSA